MASQVDNVIICAIVTMSLNLSILSLFRTRSLWTILSVRLHPIVKVHKSKSFGLKCSEDSRSQVPTLRSIIFQGALLLNSLSSASPTFSFSPHPASSFLNCLMGESDGLYKNIKKWPLDVCQPQKRKKEKKPEEVCWSQNFCDNDSNTISWLLTFSLVITNNQYR